MRRSVLILVLATVTVLAGFASPEDLEVVAESATVQVSANEDMTYVEYDFAEALAGTTVETTYRGRKSNGACEYSGSMSSSGTETRVWTEREVSHDTESCTMVTEGAWVPEATLDEEAPPMRVAGADALLAYEHDGYIKGYTEDPVGLDVASTKSRIQWSDTSTCVTSASRTSTFYWFTSSGWYRNSWITSGIATGCTRTRYTFGHYKNDVFCATIDAETSHSVWFEARGAGASSATWTNKKWGGCSGLLSTHHIFDPN